MMNAGPFAALMHAFMHGMQHMSTQSTGGQFRSRLPLQLETFGSQGSNKLAVGEASHTAEEVDRGNSDDDDDLAKLEADFAIVKKAAAKKTAEAKAEKEAAAPTAKGKVAAPTAKKAGKGKAAATKAGGEAAAPTAKGKAGKGKAAASKATGKTVAPKGKGKAATATGVGPPGGFDIDGWIATHITRAEATAEPRRRNFVSNAHKRAKSAAGLCGVDDVKPITKRARDAAGDVHDSVHKKE